MVVVGSGVEWRGQTDTPFHLKLLLEERGWISNPSTFFCPNRKALSGTEEASPLWLSGGGGSYSNTPAAAVVIVGVLLQSVSAALVVHHQQFI